MIDSTAAVGVGEFLAVVIGAYGSMRYSLQARRSAEKAVANTTATSNGFAGAVRGDLSAIRAHLAAQDMHMVNQDEALAELRHAIGRHGDMLDRLQDDGR